MGTVTHSALQLGLGLAGLSAGLGAAVLLAGSGMVWASRGRLEIASQERASAPSEMGNA